MAFIGLQWRFMWCFLAFRGHISSYSWRFLGCQVGQSFNHPKESLPTKSLESIEFTLPLRRRAGMLFSCFTVLVLLGLRAITIHAHGPVQRLPELFTADKRMFIADASNGDVIVVDLPGKYVVGRISTPAYIMILALTEDNRHLFAMRGRDTDRDYVTVIRTGYEPSTNELRFPYVTRTFVGNAPGGARGGHMTTVGGMTSMVNEGQAEMLVFAGELDGLGAPTVTSYALANPDHYHYQEVGGRLYVGHLRGGFVLVLDQNTGEELGRIEECPGLHGIARDDFTGRLFFGCSNNTVVVGTQGNETSQEVARIPYPEEQRAAAYHKAENGVFWAYTEGTIPLLYRLDTKALPYQFETVSISPSIRQATSEDGKYLLSLTRSGEFEIRSGNTGELLHSFRLAAGWDADFHEHVGKAILPDITSMGSLAYVSIPDEGRIAEIDLLNGKLLQNITTGGEPTRIVLLDTNGTIAEGRTSSNWNHTHGYGNDKGISYDHGNDGHDHGDQGNDGHDHGNQGNDGHDHGDQGNDDPDKVSEAELSGVRGPLCAMTPILVSFLMWFAAGGLL